MRHRWSIASADKTGVLSQRDGVVSVFISFFVAVLISSGFALSSDSFQHWFLIPVVLCGALAGIDAVDWFRGRVQPFDPAGLLGVYCTFALFLAPLLHVAWDFWMYEVPPPPDWRDWLGYMALLNVAGLLAYRISRTVFSRLMSVRYRGSTWRPSPEMFRVVSAVVLCATAALQASVYIQKGGITGYIEEFHKDSVAQGSFAGMGWIFMFSESFPILAAFVFIIYASRRPRKPGWFTLGLLLVILFVLQMLFGGLRGSRLNTVISLFWVVGTIHFFLRPVPKRVLFAGIVILIVFLQVYAFYKANADVTAAFEGSEERERLSSKTGYTMHSVILTDLGRADVQAYMLYKLVTDSKDFTYARGRTYLFAASLLIPRWILPERPNSKLKEGTEFQWGPGSYEPGLVESRRVYGLAGEAMLNFSPLSVPFAFALFGFLVAQMRAWIRALDPCDLRLLLAPLGIYLCFCGLNMDAEIILFIAVKNGLMPTLFIMTIATRLRSTRFAPHSVRLVPLAGLRNQDF